MMWTMNNANDTAKKTDADEINYEGVYAGMTLAQIMAEREGAKRLVGFEDDDSDEE